MNEANAETLRRIRDREISAATIMCRGVSGDPLVESMVAAGWTLSPDVDYVAGRRIRYLMAPAIDVPAARILLSAKLPARFPQLNDPHWLPVDGDCVPFSEAVTELLTPLAELRARHVIVWGYSDADNHVLAYGHQATAINTDGCDEPVIVDCTARQYHAGFPPLWIAPMSVYCKALAAATSIETVRVG